MFAKIMAARLPNFAEVPPLAKYVRNLVRWLLRRVAPAAGSAERALAVEERVTIGPKKSLFVVRCYGQHFLVAAAGDAVGPIVEIASPKLAEIAPPKPARRRREHEA
ncbi:MAG: flagellar biosynthetic protein FliO [Acidobacteriaceae bacterium]